MGLFRRRRRVDVGRYEPTPTEIAPLERVVDEGVLITETAVRMSVKNAVILSALRDRLDLDRASLAAHAADELRAAADREVAAMERVRDAVAQAAGKPKPRYVGDGAGRGEAIDAASERVRPVLVARLRELADDPEHLDELVERARADAWAEIATSFERRAEALTTIEQRDDDEERRAERLAEFLARDLGPLLEGGAAPESTATPE
ncbi:hypothetical protein [Schumannella sp. 10F1B-5-1]|uniref:hypothetical protein n=1 Tax=Schumannella sp. 10F1B-5-1 TaxID=2590780 RepID=UPI0011303393|nr:hypothetical protein [Schumannella sp. 10F1B-5-1]TPW78370.1 hypothetical protein FJ658_00760 [Schumannella sp. 10F1B-5-1]